MMLARASLPGVVSPSSSALLSRRSQGVVPSRNATSPLKGGLMARVAVTATASSSSSSSSWRIQRNSVVGGGEEHHNRRVEGGGRRVRCSTQRRTRRTTGAAAAGVVAEVEVDDVDASGALAGKGTAGGAEEDEGEGERERRDIQATLNLRTAILLVARRRWPKVLLAVAAMVGATSVLLAAPLFSSSVIECLIGVKADAEFPKLLGALIAIYTVEPLFTFAYVRCVCSLGEEIVSSLRRDLFRALLVQRVRFFDAHRAGELAALLSVEMGTVRTLVTGNVSRDRGFRAFSECVGTLAVLFCIAPKLAPILSGAIVLFAVSTASFNRSTGKLFAADAKAQGAVSATAAATLGAIRTVRSFGGEALSFRRFGSEAAAAQASGSELSKARAMLECINRGCIYASLLLLYSVGGWLVRSGQVKVGSFIACIGYAFGLIFATQGVVNTAADVKAAGAALGRARDLVTSVAPDPALAGVIPADGDAASSSSSSVAKTSASSEDGVNAKDEKTATLAAARVAAAAAGASHARAAAAAGDIELRDVRFAFPSRPDADVLTGQGWLSKNTRTQNNESKRFDEPKK